MQRPMGFWAPSFAELLPKPVHLRRGTGRGGRASRCVLQGAIRPCARSTPIGRFGSQSLPIAARGLPAPVTGGPRCRAPPARSSSRTKQATGPGLESPRWRTLVQANDASLISIQGLNI